MVPEEPVPMLSRDQLRALLVACKGSGFFPFRPFGPIRRDRVRRCRRLFRASR